MAQQDDQLGGGGGEVGERVSRSFSAHCTTTLPQHTLLAVPLCRLQDRGAVRDCDSGT